MDIKLLLNGKYKVMALIVILIVSSSNFATVTSADGDLGDTATFELYTHRNDEPERLWPKEPGVMNSTLFDPCALTVLAITGLSQVRNSPLMVAGAKLLAQRSNYNIILVNYNTFEYIRSVTVAGEQIAAFLKVLCETYDLDPADIILWGVSMGCHVAGYASSLFRVGKIIAIDPAGPIFDFLPDGLRLDKSDTDFLNVLHTSDVFGTLRNDLGHVNFIFNGGTLQPQCSLLDQSCHHLMAVQVFMDSTTTCQYHFRQCSSYLPFVLGACANKPTLIYDVELDLTDLPNDGRMYFYDSNKSQSPFCSESERTDRQFYATVC